MQSSFELSDTTLKSSLLVSLLSVWVLVGLFYYLNRYTNRKYFSTWTAGWLFYALFLTISIVLDTRSTPLLVMCKNWCVATAAVLMLWGSFQFLRLKASQRLILIVLVFVTMWSYAASYQFPGELWIHVPAFALLGLASAFTAFSFFYLRDRRPYLGAGLLTFGFGLWALYLFVYPFLQTPRHLLSTAFLISGVLQLFIAVSMIVLVLEEVRASMHLVKKRFLKEKGKSAYFRASAAMHQEQYRQLFENASESIIIVSEEDCTILDLNKAAQNLLRIERGHNLPITRYCGLEKNSGSFAPGKPWLDALCESFECQLTRQDGSQVRAQVRGGPTPFGQTKAYLLFFAEATQRAKLEQQLRQAEKLSALGQMISGVAHELNNPLAVIKGYVDLVLLAYPLEQPARNALIKVARESTRAAKLVTNFLAFARPESPALEPIHLNDIVRSVIDLRALDFESAKVRVALHLTENNPVVEASAEQLQQVAINLINNGLQAMAGVGDPELLISTRVHDERVQLRIEDSGPGVPDHVLPHIFEPFFSTKPLGEGTGLGLSICYSIVLSHRGRLFYEPRPGGGSCFTIELPVTVGKPAHSVPFQEALQETLSPRTDETGQLGRILILDDERPLAEMLNEMLGLMGYSARVCNSGAEALEALASSHFDLVISDFRMPTMNGEEFHTRVISEHGSRAPDFIFLTGDLVHDETKSFFERTGLPCILKPFQISAVEAAILAALGKEKEQCAA